MKEPTGFSIPLWLAGPVCPEGHPVRMGVPIRRGALRREELVRLVDAQGRTVPLQTEVLARWPDETIQWLLVDFWGSTGQTASSGKMLPSFGKPTRCPERENVSSGRQTTSSERETLSSEKEARCPGRESVPSERETPCSGQQPSSAGIESTSCGQEPPTPDGPAPWVREVWHLEIGRSVRSGQGPASSAEQPPSAPAQPDEAEFRRPIRMDQQEDLVWVDTGPVVFGVDQRRLGPIRTVLVRQAAYEELQPGDGSSAFPTRPNPPAAQVETSLQLADRSIRAAELDGWRVESVGPVRLTLRAEGRWPRARHLRFQARLSFFAGTGLVCYQLTVHNPRRARHRGGLWDLGDPGSVGLKDLSVLVRLPAPIQQAAARIEPAGPVLNLTETLQQGRWRLYQDSSGGPNWQSPNHVSKDGRVPCRLPGYQIDLVPEEHLTRDNGGPCCCPGNSVSSLPPGGQPAVQGRRASPVAAVQTQSIRVAVATPEFWQQFPKSLEIGRQEIRVGLWPAQWDDLHELQGGERKTHTVWLEFAPVPVEQTEPGSAPEPGGGASRKQWSPGSLEEWNPASWKEWHPAAGESQEKGSVHQAVEKLAWVHEPIQVVVPPEVWADAEVLAHYVPAGQEAVARLDQVLAEAITGPNSLQARREMIDEYGWRHYGDLYADHENAHYPGPKPVVSHYNNQFDVIYGAIVQEARTGNPAWREIYDPLARHVMDIDLYHTQEDRPAYNGGLFWPTDHYRSAQTATHRTYSRANVPADGRPYGGGPGPEHNYATGLLYYYWLTGNRDARDSVVQLAEWVLAMDDGQQTPWGLLDSGPTGLASATRSPDYHGPGRGAANSIQVLLDAWLATGYRKYLLKAEELIRRTIHPADPIQERNLLDAENRWSYTMYLAALARYLALKEQYEQLDGMYRYSQAALVHYGAWMAEQERPYLDRPEQLEYLTEAWPVQELRKANAMRMAARHADEPLQSRLLQRAEQLADRAWADWAGFPTRNSTRALAVLLVEGVRDAYYRMQRDPPAPRVGGPKHFGFPEPFLPQRQRVRQLLRRPLGWLRIGLVLLQPAHWVRFLRSLWRHRN